MVAGRLPRITAVQLEAEHGGEIVGAIWLVLVRQTQALSLLMFQFDRDAVRAFPEILANGQAGAVGRRGPSAAVGVEEKSSLRRVPLTAE